MKKYFVFSAFMFLSIWFLTALFSSGCGDSPSSPGATPTPVCANYGTAIVGSANGTQNTGYIMAYPITISSTAVTATSLSLSFGTPVAGNVIMGIYTDNAGFPVSLLASAAMAEIASSWNTVNITSTSLAPATYWIAFAYDSSTHINKDSVSTANYFYATYTYNGSLPNPMSAGTTTTSSPYCFYLRACH